jgi:hypothetical protein
MSEFQITFRGVLPEPNLRALAEAMYHKVKGEYGRASGFHLAVAEQPFARVPEGALRPTAMTRAISARVQLHAGPDGAHAAAEAWNDNPVAAVREAFAAAYTEICSRAEPLSARAPEGALRLSARAPEGALRPHVRSRASALATSQRAEPAIKPLSSTRANKLLLFRQPA